MAIISKETDNHFDETVIEEEEKEFLKIYAHSSGNPIKNVLYFFKGHIGKLLFACVFYALQCSPTWIVPIATSNIINCIVKEIEHKGNGNFVFTIVINVVIGGVSIILNPLFWTIYRKLWSLSSRSVEAGLRGAMVRKLQQLSISFHKSMSSGRIQSKVMRDVENIEAFSWQAFDSLMSILFNLLIICIIVVIKSRIVFFTFLLTIPIGVLSIVPFTNRMRKLNNNFRREIENTSSNVMDMVSLIPITRAHALENDEARKMTSSVTRVAESGYRLDVLQALFGSCNWAIFNFFSLICLAISCVLAYNGKITVGDISLYQSYFNLLLGRITAIVGLIPIISKGMESVRSVGEILSSYDVEEYNNKRALKSLKGDYKFQNVNFHYADDDRPILKGVNLDIKEGETVAFVGESGSGKTTIINMIIGFYKPVTGKVFIDGNDMTELDLRTYRQHIAVVPQNTVLFNGTIRDNITYGKPNVNEAELIEAVESANLKSLIEKLPDGLDTQIGEQGDKLSGGQRQRIAIARAIIRKPDVIIFDEATSALDTVSEAEIQSAINNLTEGHTTFIVAHRLSTVRNADKVAVMEDGVCVEFGTYDELLAKKGAFYKYKMMQS